MLTPALPPPFHLRQAVLQDILALHQLISISVRALHTPFYSPTQIELALKNLYVVNPVLVAQNYYFVITAPLTDIDPSDPTHGGPEERIVACGGWSPLNLPSEKPLDPETEAAKLKALYVHPSYGRKGLAKIMMAIIEEDVKARGFDRMEFIATLAGVKFYLKSGFKVLDRSDGQYGRVEKDVGEGKTLELVKMWKDLKSVD